MEWSLPVYFHWPCKCFTQDIVSRKLETSGFKLAKTFLPSSLENLPQAKKVKTRNADYLLINLGDVCNLNHTGPKDRKRRKWWRISLQRDRVGPRIKCLWGVGEGRGRTRTTDLLTESPQGSEMRVPRFQGGRGEAEGVPWEWGRESLQEVKRIPRMAKEGSFL